MNLTRDFVQNGGIFMMIDTENGLSSTDLNRTQAGMLTSNRIHRLLALRIKEVDNKITFQYDVTGLKMLSHIWFSHRHSIQMLYKLLYEILDALDSSREYMLTPLQFVVHEDYIFVEGTGAEYAVRLTYLPLREGFDACSVGQDIKQLIIRLLGSIKELEGDGLQRLLQMCDQDIFDLQGMKLLLLEYLEANDSKEMSIATASETAIYSQAPAVLDTGGATPVNASSSSRAKGLVAQRKSQISTDGDQGDHLSESNPAVDSYLSKTTLRKTERQPEGEGEYGPFLGQRGRSRGERVSHMAQSQAPQLQAPSFNDPPAWNYGEAPADDDEMEGDISTNGPRKYRTYIMSACILLTASVWRYLYLDHPSLSNLIIASAGTVLLSTVTLLAWFGKLRLSRGVEDYSEHVAELDSGELENYEPANSGIGAKVVRFQVDRVTGYMSKQQKKGELEGSEMENNRGKHIGRLGHEEERTREGIGGTDRYLASDSDNYQEVNSCEYYSSLKENTDILASSSSDATRFLGPEDRKLAQQRQEHDTQVACLYLLDTEGNYLNETVPIRLSRSSFTIGRGEESAYRISDAEGLSRLHIEISESTRGEYRIKDLASTNGSLLNNEAMIPYKEYLLQHRDILKLPGVAFQYSSPLSAERPSNESHGLAN